jgi:hypothetical protein
MLIMQNLPTGVGDPDRGIWCMWGMHNLPRSRCPVPNGRFCMVRLRRARVIVRFTAGRHRRKIETGA